MQVTREPTVFKCCNDISIKHVSEDGGMCPILMTVLQNWLYGLFGCSYFQEIQGHASFYFCPFHFRFGSEKACWVFRISGAFVSIAHLISHVGGQPILSASEWIFIVFIF